MKTALRLLVPLSFVLVACGSGTNVAATVYDNEITVDDVDALVSAEGAVDAEFFRTQLTGMIISTAMIHAAEEQFGITATDEEIQTQYDEFKVQLETGAESYEAALEANGITDLRVRQAAEEQLIATALQAELSENVPEVSDDEVAAELEANAEQYRNACIKHILLETEAEAAEVKGRLDGGEDFATVAGETSIEPQAAESGGDLGCSPLGRYVPEFSAGAKAAEIGVVTEPVESEFGWHLILVESIDDDATVETAIRTQLESVGQQTFLTEWLEAALSDAEITVDEQFGEWVTDPQPAILPPADEVATTSIVTTTTAG